MAYRLGVDLGTTFTAAAVDDGSGPTMVGLGNRALQVPSVLFLQQDGTFLFGEAAERRAAVEPDRAVREFKRRLGDTVPILVAGQPFSASGVDRETARLGGRARGRAAGVGTGRGGVDLSRELGRLQAGAARPGGHPGRSSRGGDVHRARGGCLAVHDTVSAVAWRPIGRLRPGWRHLRRVRPPEAGGRLQDPGFARRDRASGRHRLRRSRLRTGPCRTGRCRCRVGSRGPAGHCRASPG